MATHLDSKVRSIGAVLLQAAQQLYIAVVDGYVYGCQTCCRAPLSALGSWLQTTCTVCSHTTQRQVMDTSAVLYEGAGSVIKQQSRDCSMTMRTSLVEG